MTTASVRHMPRMEESRLVEMLTAGAPSPSLRRNNPFISNFSTHQALPMEPAEESPLLVRPIPGSYQQLFHSLLTTDFDPTSRTPKTLPPELCNRVLSFLTVKRVQQKNVCATNSSSHDGVHHLSTTLLENECTWWLSRAGSMPDGRGQQWIQYLLNRHNSCLQRLSAVSVKIPPMPQGPLSAREFVLQSFSIDQGWHAITPIFQISNQAGWQKFTLPEAVDVNEVRLVCLSNQIAEYLSNAELTPHKSRFESVGFFSVRFE
eukprot:CAMPEP_0172442260 /NCGR_PEP_ID=MMETSP1065-20121228/2731_1 /TAXON_ID=265537 /ORGANISM="Amphiprora paludosa, Strain CCMP125" /LENGTH=261 /DNA_ID=CAMNT_0013192061 /DNA_START=28 /DNA_END=813 /DNA_ORIENTATION=+